MLLTTLPGGDRLERIDNAIILRFAGARRSLSSAMLGGGVRDDLEAAFNYDLSWGKTVPCELLGGTMEEHLSALALRLGLDPERCTGLCTGAQMDHATLSSLSWDDFTVTAAVTAGIDENGGRAGDPASWQERDGVLGLPVGTINLLLHISADLPPGTLATALITATEAKCAAVQELLLPSRYSRGLATGSGTDGAVVVCAPGAAPLTDAGKHSKLGELIGRTVLAATREALFLQSGACPGRLQDPERHLARWRLSREDRDRFAGRPVQAALAAHLLDLNEWGVFSTEQTAPALDKLKEESV